MHQNIGISEYYFGVLITYASMRDDVRTSTRINAYY